MEHSARQQLEDLASLHGTYRKVEETTPALRQIGEGLQTLGVASARWYLDAPVSNSGRLRELMLEMASAHDFAWEVELVSDPDKTLAERGAEGPVISSDSWVIDQVVHWCNLTAYLLRDSERLWLLRLDEA